MFSGKSTELVRRIRRYSYADYRCMLIRYAKDERYSITDVATHDGQLMPAVSVMELSLIESNSENFDVIGIDEGQFFPDVVTFCEQMANKGKIVIVAALDGTYLRESFGDILNLVPLAENIIKLTSVCMSCFNEAAFTKRIGNEKELEIIGGVEKYMAVCRECHQLQSPVKRSPFKVINHINEVDKETIKRQLFSDDTDTAY